MNNKKINISIRLETYNDYRNYARSRNLIPSRLLSKIINEAKLYLLLSRPFCFDFDELIHAPKSSACWKVSSSDNKKLLKLAKKFLTTRNRIIEFIIIDYLSVPHSEETDCLNTLGKMLKRRGAEELSTEEKFWSRVLKGDKEEDCWAWTGGIIAKKVYGGMPDVKLTGEVYAHRYSWKLHNGPIPEGMFVLHHCDNPPCVNPAHLFLGTQADNVHDMMKKKRDNFYGWRDRK